MGRRKRTDTDTAVKSFSETKEDSIAVFTENREQAITQDIIDMFDMKPVGQIGKLGGQHIVDFNGKDYKESLEMAYAWKKNWESKNIGLKLIFSNYFPQRFKSKSILVGYSIKGKVNE